MDIQRPRTVGNELEQIRRAAAGPDSQHHRLRELWSDDPQRQLDAARYGGTKQQLSLDDVRELRVPLADLMTQEVVLPRLLTRLEALTTAEWHIRRVTDVLMERRQALITAAVTGQLDLPRVVA